MITCDFCGTKNPDNAMYCQTCGERIQDKDHANIQEHLKNAMELLDAEKQKEAIIEFEKAAILGWKGDYYIIAKAYASELFAGEKNSITKAYKWFERFFSDFRAGRMEYKLLFGLIDGIVSGIDIRIRYAWEAADHQERVSVLSNLTEIYESILLLVIQNECKERLDKNSQKKISDILLSIGESYYYGLILHGKWGEIDIPVNIKQAYQAFKLSIELGNEKAKLFIEEMNDERIECFKKSLTHNVRWDGLSDYCFLDIDADDGFMEKDDGYCRLISRMIQSDEYTVSENLYIDIRMGHVRKGIDKLLSSLGEAEFDVMKYIYGLDYEDPLSYRATAVMLDIPYSKIIEIEERTVKKLRTCKQTKMLKDLLLGEPVLRSGGVDYSEMFEKTLNEEINEFLRDSEVETEGFLSHAVIEHYSSRLTRLNSTLDQIKGMNRPARELLKRVGIEKLCELLILSESQFTELIEMPMHPVMRESIKRTFYRYQSMAPLAAGFTKGNEEPFSVKELFAASTDTPITRMKLSYSTIEKLLKRGYLFLSDMTRDEDWSILDENKELMAYLCCGGNKLKRLYISSSLAYCIHMDNIDSLSSLEKKYKEMPWNLQQQAIKVFHSHNLFGKMKYEKPKDIGCHIGSVLKYNIFVKSDEDNDYMGLYSVWNDDLSKCICTFFGYNKKEERLEVKKAARNIAGMVKTGEKDDKAFYMSQKSYENMLEFCHLDEILCGIHDYNYVNGITEYEVLV